MDYSNRNLTELGGMDEDMKLQIHCMEKEAYSNVLRAFIAQSDLLSWGKEGLITELRKELNVTDTEHGELLVKINSDESIKLIREWRKGERHLQEPLYGKVKAPGFASNPVGNALQKKVKTSQPSVSKSQHYVSHGVPSLGTQSWKYVPHIPPTSGSLPSSVPVQTRDDQHSGEFAMFSSGKPEQSTRIDSNNYQAPADGKRKVVLKSQPKKGSHAPAAKKRSDVIEIRATDKLLHQDLCRAEYAASGANPLKFWLVERTIYGTKNPNPVQVEKAKLVLREHERAILEALDKLADVSDGDDSPNALQQHLPHKERAGNGRGTLVPGDFYRQMGGSHGYQSEGFVPVHPVRLGVPCINLQGEEETP